MMTILSLKHAAAWRLIAAVLAGFPPPRGVCDGCPLLSESGIPVWVAQAGVALGRFHLIWDERTQRK